MPVYDRTVREEIIRMKKVLKNLDPSIRPYLGDAFCFSIIDDVAFESGWVYDKYMQIEFTPEDGQIKYADYDYYDFVPGEGVFIKSFTEIPIGCCNQEYICGMIQEMLDEDEYFFALWDEQVITNYLNDEKETGGYEHGCFLYGYDSEEQMFYTQGYLGEEKWKRVQIPYDVFYQALSYFPEKGQIAFIGYKLVEDYEWKFDFDRMKSGLSNYQKSLQNEDGRILDLRAEQRFFGNIMMEQQIHYPSLYCLHEHKSIMEKRVDFLMERKYIKRDEKLCGYVRQLKKDYKKLMLMGVQFIMNRQSFLPQAIYKKAMEALENEKVFLELLMKKVV